MTPECNTESLAFSILPGREVIARFDGGTITSDGGALLLPHVERRTRILERFASCFTDHRDPERIEHTVLELISQRVYALALGYEDLNDHDQLRFDPLLATIVGKPDPSGTQRLRQRDRGKPLAGKSTLNRLELTPTRVSATSRYKKICLDHQAVGRFFVDIFLEAYPTPPEAIILDLDATDDPLHGHQLGRFFHGYYGGYCYLPLYIFCGEHLLCARLRPANLDASAGSVKELQRIVAQIRTTWPGVRILIRADSGFCREEILCWCEQNQVDYLLGLAKNPRLLRTIAPELQEAKEQFERTQMPARVYKDFGYQTLDSWSRQRRVVAKAEHLEKGSNPRFVVTSLSPEQRPARVLYEEDYCERGETENRIKEQQLYLFADRTSASTMRANQLRLWVASVAYLLLEALRRLGLQGTPLADAQCQTIRLKLLKIGALVRVTVRKVWVALSESYPYQAIFRQVFDNLGRVLAPSGGPTRVIPPPLRC
jgi:hypothetical protein